jgi:hypothetical protein
VLGQQIEREFSHSLAHRVSSGELTVLFGFKYGPWIAAIMRMEPEEQGGAETCYVGQFMYRGCIVNCFELERAEKAEEHFKRHVLDELKVCAKERLGPRVRVKDIESLDLVARVVRDFYLHEVEGGTVSEWISRYDLTRVAKIRPVRGPIKPVLIDLGGDCYHLQPSKFLVPRGRHATRQKR